MMLPSKLQIYIGLVWPWSLTSWPPKLNISCPWPVSNGIKISCRSQNIVFTSLVTDTRMDGRTDKQADNTVPLPASLRNKNHTKRKVYNYYPGDVKSTTTKSFVNKTTIAVGSWTSNDTHTHTHTHTHATTGLISNTLHYLFIYLS